MTARWETVVGLEVHVQLVTASKLFCGCATAFGAPPNTQICPVCAGLPGALPVPGEAAVAQAARLGLALGAQVHPRSRWDRKSYFYPDLPKGYQITQYERPLCTGGVLAFTGADGGAREVHLVRLHQEEDAGKSLHDPALGRTRVDFNRAGVPLAELVTRPELRSGAEAADFLRALRALVRWLGVSDGNMQEGSLRCDANVSLRRPGDPALGPRTEIKNLNSFRFLQRAIEHEVERQAAVLETGGRVRQETRLYDEARGVTRPMRSKEEAHDYRYFPEPDLPELTLDPAWLEALAAGLPELPGARQARWVRELGLSGDDAALLAADRERADFFETAVRAYAGAPRTLAAWMRTEVLREANLRPGGLSALRLTPAALADLLGRVDAGEVSRGAAREVLARLAESGGQPAEAIDALGLRRVADPAALAAVVDAVLAAHPEQAARCRAGEDRLLGWLMGQAMRQAGGAADPATVRALLRERLFSAP